MFFIFCPNSKAIAVSSGTDALILSLVALYDYGAKRGDEIILPALTFVATANAIVHAGFKPVFVDVNRYTLNIDYEKIQEKITDKTRAIVAVHLMGNPCDIEDIKRLCNTYNIFLIEDCAEAHGARVNNRLIGTFGDFACYSLYAAHIISTIEGGMITSKLEGSEVILKSLRNHGLQLKGSDWDFNRIGFSSKMNELEACVGLSNLENLDIILSTRRRNYYYLADKFYTKRLYHDFIILRERMNEQISPHAFSIIIRNNKYNKQDLINFLTNKGIDSRNLFYSIPTQCEAYQYLGHKLGDFPEAEFCSDYGIHIGVHQDLNQKDVEYIIDVFEEFIHD